MNVRLKRIDKDLPLPKFATEGSFGFDLYSRSDIEVPPKGIALIPSNVIIEAPEDYALLLLPRSSMPRKKHLSFPHSIGLIDRDYSGETDEIMIQVMNFTDEPVHVERGERIAQGMFVQVGKPVFTEVETMREQSRGGFGSTKGYKKSFIRNEIAS